MSLCRLRIRVVLLLLVFFPMRQWYLAGAILGIFWTCVGIYMLTMLPALIWFVVADILLYVPAALIGVKLGGALTGKRPDAVATQ